MNYHNFRAVYTAILNDFQDAGIVTPNTWQGTDVSKKPEMATHELEDYYFSFPIGTTDLGFHRNMIGPNLPWADDHFEKDRISGEPLNPGYTWKDWPFALKADTFRDKHGQFNHTYAERYWPKFAGATDQGELRGTTLSLQHWEDYMDVAGRGPQRRELTPEEALRACQEDSLHTGIRYPYGDLNDVVNLLVKNPLTRNAYLPVWFPEDTGVVHGGRTPCSIGYLFRVRKGQLSIFYDIRSCDFVRHFQDDVYLTIRLLLWVLNECVKRDEKWRAIKPGRFTMHIGSFHIFENDYRKVMKDAGI